MLTRSTAGKAGASAPWRAPSSLRASCQVPEYPHDLAQDLDVLRKDRLEGAVLRLQPDPALLLVERLDGRLVGGLVVTCERDDDLAVPRILRPAHDDDVAVEDARFDHRFALHAEQEVAAKGLRHGQLVLDVLVGEKWPAGCDLPEERQLRHGDGRLLLAPRQLERARLRRVALEEAGPLEIRQVRMHRGGRGEADGLPDLADGRRIAVEVDVLDEESPDFLLAAGQFHDALAPLVLVRSMDAGRTCVRQEGRESFGRRQGRQRAAWTGDP